MSGENFYVQWNSHKQNLTSNLKKLLEAQEFVDVTLVTEGQQIRCHRLVLSANSRFFDSVLQGTETNYPIVVLPAEIKMWHMQGLVDYMYLGEVTVSKTGLTSFLKSAEMLQIRGLCDVAEKFTYGKEEFEAKKKNIEEKIEQILPKPKLPNIVENSPQVVTTNTNDASISINSSDSVHDINQRIKKIDTPVPLPVYQERGPILNNVGNYMQPPAPPETPVSHAITTGPILNNIVGYMQPPTSLETPISHTIKTRPSSTNESFENRTNRPPQGTPISQNLTPIDFRNFPSNFENQMNKPPIETPVSNTITTASTSMFGNSKNVPGVFESNMNDRHLPSSEQIISPEAFEMLRRINRSPTPTEKRTRLSHPPQLYSEPPKDFHLGHLFPTDYSKIPPLKRNVMPKNSQDPAKSTPDNQPFQQFTVPGNYGPPPMMHLPHRRPPMPGLVRSTNTPHPQFHPQYHPHPSIYLHPNLRVFANNFKM